MTRWGKLRVPVSLVVPYNTFWDVCRRDLNTLRIGHDYASWRTRLCASYVDTHYTSSGVYQRCNRSLGPYLHIVRLYYPVFEPFVLLFPRKTLTEPLITFRRTSATTNFPSIDFPLPYYKVFLPYVSRFNLLSPCWTLPYSHRFMVQILLSSLLDSVPNHPPLHPSRSSRNIGPFSSTWDRTFITLRCPLKIRCFTVSD